MTVEELSQQLRNYFPFEYDGYTDPELIKYWAEYRDPEVVKALDDDAINELFGQNLQSNNKSTPVNNPYTFKYTSKHKPEDAAGSAKEIAFQSTKGLGD